MVPKTILYAEDNVDDVFIFKLAFKRATLPHTLHIVDDGQQAIEWFDGIKQFADRDKHPLPQVLVTDIKMPRKNGFELLEWVRAHEVFAKVPVIVLSSSDEPRDVKRAYELGATTYFVKTPQYQDVIQFLRTLAVQLPT
jgi:CheY-like chemotaxis protein